MRTASADISIVFQMKSFLNFFFNPLQYVSNEQVNHQQVSTFLTAGNVKFMLLHGGKSEDSIKNFFNDVYELYVKLLMNPFYAYDTPITSKAFDTRVRAIARRYLS